MGQWASDGSYIDYNVKLKESNLSGSDAIIPSDIQSHLQTTILTHNGVTIALSGTNDSTWIDTDGFDKLVFNLKTDSTQNTQATVKWSPDGTNIFGAETIMASGSYSSSFSRSAIADTKMRYAQITVYNLDTTAPHAMTGYAYLKA